jgi:hypothetical protein
MVESQEAPSAIGGMARSAPDPELQRGPGKGAGLRWVALPTPVQFLRPQSGVLHGGVTTS